VQSAFSWFPTEASNFALRVDMLMLYISVVSFLLAFGITATIVYFCLRYTRINPDEIGAPIEGNMRLEITWIVIPMILVLTMFAWGAVVYVNYRVAPQDTLDIYVTGKQWMWKIQQPSGAREINELHVPAGRNVKLIMGSEDVIHDFFVPAFRIKMDVVPGRYNTMWFRPTKPGRYRFFCSQYCGTSHALMGGYVTVMMPADYAAWLAGSAEAEANPVVRGEKLFAERACSTCHLPDGGGRGPSLVGVYGSTVQLADGTTVHADDAYIRESILDPSGKIVAGYPSIMPSFQGQLGEEQILNLISYIRSLQLPARVNSELSAERERR
jgi:cytochrome c oxidase subunit II